MWVQQRNIIKLSGLIQMNWRKSLYISGIFMISCIFLVTIENFVSDVVFEEVLYQAWMCSMGGIRPVLSRKSLQRVLDNSQSSCRSNVYFAPLISVILVSQSKLDHSTLKISKESNLMTSSYIHTWASLQRFLLSN